MAGISLSELLNISYSSLDVLTFNKLYIRRDLTDIIGSESCAVWFVVLSQGINGRENIEKSKLTKSVLSKVSDKVKSNTQGLTKFLSKITFCHI